MKLLWSWLLRKSARWLQQRRRWICRKRSSKLPRLSRMFVEAAHRMVSSCVFVNERVCMCVCMCSYAAASGFGWWVWVFILVCTCVCVRAHVGVCVFTCVLEILHNALLTVLCMWCHAYRHARGMLPSHSHMYVSPGTHTATHCNTLQHNCNTHVSLDTQARVWSTRV